ncbi:MAG: molecular chaperone HtpG [Magnetococcales bacterium]|nr:molecular chaperone HtpG [Magnetococcales bacterium]MBF0150780.1 molecular chaperone HtpG [Magnetococcales bacterium]MBF0173683.1 molecular chaperone HtpG [Magnetococcales bacterium]
MSDVEHKETHAFQTEVTQLLHLMIHSLYSNKEIFLRELISNASDAADKLRFEALSNAALYENDPNLELRITFDKDAKTITIADNGIGMNKEEVISNIGTIARSGTREFLKSLTGDQAKDAHLIGQFGVGFYSSFIVASSVTLTTRRAGLSRDQGVRWESSGDGQYTIETVDKEQRGTEIVLHLADEHSEFLDDWRLRSIIRKFSDHVSWPILMIKPDYSKKEEDKETEEKPPEWETVNKASALWTRNKSDIKDEEYKEFYKHISHDFEEPLTHLHVRLEGKQEYTLLLYVPKRAPFDLWDRDGKHGVKLYVRRVFIMEGAKELMPRYLRFIRGIIDSSDLPLNISREILQNNPMVEAIRKGTVGKVFGLFEDLAEKEPDTFKQLWKTFGLVLKEGVIEDFSNKDKLAKLLRFASTHADTADQEVSLKDYVGRMKPDQEKIYYVTAESFPAAKNSPHLEIFRKKGIEVLLLSDRVDEWLVNHLTEFEGKSLQSVAKGGLDLGKLENEEEKKDLEKKEGDFKGLLERVKKSLGETVKEVRLTHRLTDSPACLVSDEHDMSATMARILKEAGQSVPASMRILELNPGHPLVVRLNNETNEDRFNDLAHILYDQSMLGEGGQLDDPPGFIRKLNKLLLEMAS